MMLRTQTSMRLTDKTLQQLRYLKFIRQESTAKVLAHVLNNYYKDKGLSIPEYFTEGDFDIDWSKMQENISEKQNDR
jgi:hypothetical protein